MLGGAAGWGARHAGVANVSEAAQPWARLDAFRVAHSSAVAALAPPTLTLADAVDAATALEIVAVRLDAELYAVASASGTGVVLGSSSPFSRATFDASDGQAHLLALVGKDTELLSSGIYSDWFGFVTCWTGLSNTLGSAAGLERLEVWSTKAVPTKHAITRGMCAWCQNWL